MNLLGLLNRASAPDPAEKRRLRKAAAERAGYAVGDHKPPEAHRFRKGQSGNPRGRPRKVEAVGEVLDPLPKMSAQEMLIAEAYRMVRVRDGKRRIEMPAIQAAFRELSMAAARGDRLALSCMAQLVFRIEAQRPAQAPAAAALPQAAIEEPTGNPNGEEWWFDEVADTWCYHPKPEEPEFGPLSPEVASALDYKTAWTKVLAQAASEKVDLASPVPHPDEIVIDRERDLVAFTGEVPERPLSLDGLRALVARMRADLAQRRETATREKVVAYSPEHMARCRLSGLVLRLETDLEAYLAGDAPGPDVVAPSYEIVVVEPSGVTLAPRDMDGPDEPVGNRAAAGVEPPVSAISALDPEAAERVAEAEAYKRIWSAGLAEAARLGVPLEPPVPHPDAVEIDPVAGTVRYRVPIGDGEGATLDQAYAGIQQARALETGLRRDLCFTDYRDMPEAERRHAAAKQVADAMSAAIGAWQAEYGAG